MKLMPSIKRYIGSFSIAVVLALSGIPTVPWGGFTDAEAYTRPGYNGKIAFTSNRGDGQQIYVMDVDGSNQTALTSTGNNTDAYWSPDGSKLVYSSDRNGNDEIYVIDAGGTNELRLTNVAGMDWQPRWSPDGSRIAFTSGRDGNMEIYVMDADGSNQTRLTNAAGMDANSQWSPDGSKISFNSTRDSDQEIYVMDADGSNQTRVSTASGLDALANWSADSSKLVYTSARSGNDELYIVNSDGSGELAITNTVDDDDEYAHWTTSGKLAFVRYDDGWDTGKLGLINADGSNLQIIDHAGGDASVLEEVSWSPDQSKILTTGYSAGWSSADIFSMDAGGLNLQKLTTDGDSWDAVWQPLPNTPPVLDSKTTSLQSGTSRLIDVLAGASDEEVLSGSNITVTGVPAHGAASVEAGKIRYTADEDYAGFDSVGYEACDSFILDQQCSVETLAVTVNPAVGVTKVGFTNTNGTSTVTSASLHPTFSGTATPGSEVTVEIHSDPIILTSTTDGDGNWSITPPYDLPSGEHMVYISATLNGFTTELDSFTLVVGNLASTGEGMWTILIGSSGVLGIGIYLLRYRTKTFLTSVS